MSELVLYIDHHWISPYALSAFVALEEKGVPYRIEELAAAQLIKPGRTSLFSAFSIADVDLAMMLQRLSVNGDALPAALTEFANAVWARPSVQRWHTHPRPPFEPY